MTDPQPSRPAFYGILGYSTTGPPTDSLSDKVQQAREEAMDFLHGKDRPGGLDGRFAGPVGLVRALTARAEQTARERDEARAESAERDTNAEAVGRVRDLVRDLRPHGLVAVRRVTAVLDGPTEDGGEG